MDRQQPQVAAIHHHGDIGSPALKMIIRPPKRSGLRYAPGYAVTDREPRRQVTETRRRPIQQARPGFMAGREDIATCQLPDGRCGGPAVSFSTSWKAITSRAKCHDLLRDHVVVGAFSRHAALSVRVVQMLQVPGRNAQLAAEGSPRTARPAPTETAEATGQSSARQPLQPWSPQHIGPALTEP